MFDPRETLANREDWQILLRVYVQKQSVAKAVEGADDWIERVAVLETIDDEELSRLHGELIAYGLLDVTLKDRILGVQYRPSSLAKQSLNALDPETAKAA